MSERGTVFQAPQVGVETVAGTAVPADKRLVALSIEPKAMVPTVAQRNMGSKFVNSTFNKKEYTMADVKGEACFRTLAYLLNCIINSESPTGPVDSAYTWTYLPNTFGPDTPDTLTVESGSSAGAERFSYATLDSLALRYTKDEVGLTGSMFGQELSEQITLTTPTSVNTVWHVDGGTTADGGTFRLEVLGDWTTDLAWNITAVNLATALKALVTVGASDVTTSGTGVTGDPWIITFVGALAGENIILGFDDTLLTDGGIHIALVRTETVVGYNSQDVTPVPIDPTQMDIYVGASTGSLVKLDRCFEAEFAINNRFTMVFTLDTDEPSFSAVVEKAPELSAQLVIEHNADGAAFMDDLRDKTTLYCRMLATGPIIGAGATHYKLQITFPFHFKDNSRGDKDDVWSSTYHLQPIYNAAFGSAVQIVLINDLATL